MLGGERGEVMAKSELFFLYRFISSHLALSRLYAFGGSGNFGGIRPTTALFHPFDLRRVCGSIHIEQFHPRISFDREERLDYL